MHTHNYIRSVVRKFGERVQLQLLQLALWFWFGLSLGYGLDFLLGLWLFLFGALALEKGALPWLVIGLLLELFCLSRLTCFWNYSRVMILMICSYLF
jgi:hypothetical protein